MRKIRMMFLSLTLIALASPSRSFAATATPTPTPAPVLIVYCGTVTVERTGTYYAWHFVTAPDSNHDSFWVSVDGHPQFLDDACENVWPCDPPKWTRITNRALGIGNAAKIYLTKNVPHTFNFYVREGGANIWTVKVSMDRNADPATDGVTLPLSSR